MTEPLKFIGKIPAMTGGRETIMLVAHELWRGVPTTEAPTQKERAKAAVETILAAIKSLARAPLATLIDKHVQIVEDEFVLMEGDAPDDGDTSDAALEWWALFYEAQIASLAGDATLMVGAEAVSKWVRGSDETTVLVDLILAKPVEDTAHALTACGIAQGDVAELATLGVEPQPSAEVRTEPQPSAEVRAPRRRAPKIDGPNGVTAAAQRALTVLSDHGVKDVEVAAAIGVSRTQVISYRKGATLLAPSPDQMSALTALFASVVDRLGQAIGDLQSAVAIQDLD